MKSARQHYQIEHETYARIVWGDSREDITQWLVNEKRLTYFQAKTLITKLMKFRNYEVRKLGIGHFWIGLLILIPGGFLTHFTMGWGSANLFSIPFAVTVFGFYRFTMGLTRLILPHLFQAHRDEDELGDLENFLSDNADNYRLY